MDSAFPMDPTSFLDDVCGYLDKGYHEMALEAFDGVEKKLIMQNTWDAVPRLCIYLTQEVYDTREQVIDAVEHILSQMVEICSPKEMILVMLEQAENIQSDVRFTALLPPIRACLMRLTNKRPHSLAIALETLTTYPHWLPLPGQQDLELRERLLLDADDNTRKICHVTKAYLNFLEPFVAEVDWKLVSRDDRSKLETQVTSLLQTCIALLDAPLAFADLSIIKERPSRSRLSVRQQNSDASAVTMTEFKPETRILAERLMTFVNKLVLNHPRLASEILSRNEALEKRRVEILKEREERKAAGEEEEDIDEEMLEKPTPFRGLAVLSYLVYGECLQDDSVPHIHSPGYTMEFNLPFCVHLLRGPVDQLVYKGLTLLEGLLSRVPDSSLPTPFQESPRLRDTLQALVVVMTTSKVKELNQFAVVLLRLILNKFTSEGRFKMMLYLLNSTEHSGVLGYTVTMVKDEIDAALRQGDASLSPAVLGDLYRTIFNLPGGATADVLENAERIMGALNLLRYLVLRDLPSANKTTIWSHEAQIQSGFCAELRTGINMTRAHYNLEINQVKSGAKGDAGEVEFTVDGEQTPDMSPQLRLDLCHKALHTLDMVESVLGRVGEVVEQQRKLDKV